MLTSKIALPDSPHPIIFSKNAGFWALYVAKWNECRFFRLINKNIFFSFFAAGFCPKNLAFARKIMVLPESRTPMLPVFIGTPYTLIAVRYICTLVYYVELWSSRD